MGDAFTRIGPTPVKVERKNDWTKPNALINYGVMTMFARVPTLR